MDLFGDYWVANKNKEYCIHNVTWNDILNNLVTLDGKLKTELVLEKESSSVSISGGNDGYFILIYYVENNSYSLVKNTMKSKKIKLVTGGQSGLFESKYCFKIDEIKTLLKDYYNDNDIFNSYKWEES